MGIGEEELFVDTVRGAVDTYIRMINESEKNDIIGKGIIKPEWYYYIDTENEDFVILLEIRGLQKEIKLKKVEWKSYSSNMLGNVQLQQLAKRWS